MTDDPVTDDDRPTVLADILPSVINDLPDLRIASLTVPRCPVIGWAGLRIAVTAIESDAPGLLTVRGHLVGDQSNGRLGTAEVTIGIYDRATYEGVKA